MKHKFGGLLHDSSSSVVTNVNVLTEKKQNNNFANN